jgi:hypothetical protein
VATGWGKGSTRQWRRLRLVILERDGWTCRIGLAGVCVGKADCVHHVLGRAQTGDDPRWLQAACSPCNLAIGNPQRLRKRAAVIPMQRRAQQYNRW